MEIKEYVKSFVKENCVCGKTHQINLPEIIVERKAIEKLPSLIEKYGAKKPFVLADASTFKACGERVCEILRKGEIPFSKHVFQKGNLEPDEGSVGSAIMHYDHSCDLIIGVGSGVINDISKIVAKTTSNPYFIVGTAPSMDGYASATSSVARDGVKISLPSKCAEVIIGDIDVLEKAPERTLKAGIGDMLAKYISITEWRIANAVVGEYYCPAVSELIRNAVSRCVENAEGLLLRKEEAIKAVFEGLVIGGVAMAIAECSRPASGMEHYFSHVWDMRGLEFGTKIELHGLQCAVGTYISAKLYEKALSLTPNKEKALAYANEFNKEEWNNTLRAFLGSSAETMIELEKKEGKYEVGGQRLRLETILSKWQEICEIVREELPSMKKLDEIYQTLSLPKTAKELGIDADIYTTFLATKDIRDKYILSRLLWDLGEIEEFRKILQT